MCTNIKLSISIHEDPRTPAVWGAALLGAHQPQSSSAGAEPEQSGEGVNVESSQFPVIVFCHGLGGMRTTSSGICCDLASHGYVVAAVEHRCVCVRLSTYLTKNGASVVTLYFHHYCACAIHKLAS